MARGRQRDRSVTLATTREIKWRATLCVLLARRHLPSPSLTSAALIYCVQRCNGNCIARRKYYKESLQLLPASRNMYRASLSDYTSTLERHEVTVRKH
eukprot:IDg6791t1